MLDLQNIQQYRGAKVMGPSGDRIGKVDEIYLDDRSGQPEWALVNTGLFGTRSTFIPLAQANASGSDIQVPYDSAKVKDAPNIDADQHLSEAEERELYTYYGLDYDDPMSDTSATTDSPMRDTGGDVAMTDYATTPATGVADMGTTGYAAGDSADTAYAAGDSVTDDAMTRSEERLNVGTEQREAGRARLRKFITTETVSQTVPVTREEVRVEREPITDANRPAAMQGQELKEEEHEVVLHEEVPVVDKEVVPAERVRLDTEQVTEQVRVQEEIRKENIEVDEGDATTGTRTGTTGTTGTQDTTTTTTTTTDDDRSLLDRAKDAATPGSDVPGRDDPGPLR